MFLGVDYQRHFGHCYFTGTLIGMVYIYITVLSTVKRFELKANKGIYRC